jgi:hypothetical protein
MHENRPKPTYNSARIFNSLAGHWLKLTAADDDVCAVAALDERAKQLAVVLVNYRPRFATTRHVRLSIDHLPAEFKGGRWKEFRIDSNQSNIFTDASHCELEPTASGMIGRDELTQDLTLLPNTVALFRIATH